MPSAKVNAFRQVMQVKSHPHPHHGQSICAGKVTRSSPHEQKEIKSSLAFFK
jgi:hypothetical protein